MKTLPLILIFAITVSTTLLGQKSYEKARAETLVKIMNKIDPSEAPTLKANGSESYYRSESFNLEKKIFKKLNDVLIGNEALKDSIMVYDYKVELKLAEMDAKFQKLESENKNLRLELAALRAELENCNSEKKK